MMRPHLHDPYQCNYADAATPRNSREQKVDMFGNPRVASSTRGRKDQIEELATQQQTGMPTPADMQHDMRINGDGDMRPDINTHVAMEMDMDMDRSWCVMPKVLTLPASSGDHTSSGSSAASGAAVPSAPPRVAKSVPKPLPLLQLYRQSWRSMLKIIVPSSFFSVVLASILLASEWKAYLRVVIPCALVAAISFVTCITTYVFHRLDRRRTRRLFEIGIPTLADIVTVDRDAVNDKIDLHWTFVVQDFKYVSASHEKLSANNHRHKKQVGDQIWILYDPRRPRYAKRWKHFAHIGFVQHFDPLTNINNT